MIEELSALLPTNADFFATNRSDQLQPALCFGKIEGQFYTPSLMSDCKNAVKEFYERQDSAITLQCGYYNLLLPKSVVSEAGSTEELTVGRLATLILNEYLFHSLIYYNSIEDKIQSLIEPVSFKHLKVDQLNYDVFANTISRHFDIEIEVYRLQPNEQVVSLCHRSEFPITHVSDLKNRVRHAINKGRVIDINSDNVPAKIFGSGDSADLHVYVFPIRSKTRPIIRRNEFAIVRRRNSAPLSVLEVACMDACVEEYLYTRTRLGQQDCLYWQTEQLTELVEHLKVQEMDQDKVFLDYMHSLAEFIIRTTQGHSFSFLEYHGKTKSLRRVVAHTEDALNAESNRHAISELAPVPVSQTYGSLSAHLFSNWNKYPERFLYITNIREQEEWPTNGLQFISCERNRAIDDGELKGAKTLSEIAIIVQDQDMPIGVVCVESPYDDGLVNDQLFLRQVINNASIFWSFLFRMNDQLWLRRNLQLQDISHGLSKLVLAMDDGEMKDELSELTQRVIIAKGQEVDHDESFEDRMNDMLWNEAGKSDYLLAGVKELVRFFSPERHQVPFSVQSAAIQIVRDLFRNLRHTKNPYAIRIATRDDYGGAKNILVIRTVLDMKLTEAELRDAFRRPIKRAHRDHVGLYMMGVITRTWGGRLDFDRRPSLTDRELEICIPFDRRGDKLA